MERKPIAAPGPESQAAEGGCRLDSGNDFRSGDHKALEWLIAGNMKSFSGNPGESG